MPRHPSHILELAKRGAEHRYQELNAEIAALEKVFSHLRYGSAVSPGMPDAIDEPTVRRRRRRKMSEAARKAVSDRMKKVWAARRKAKKA
jgi:hypothetical protein